MIKVYIILNKQI